MSSSLVPRDPTDFERFIALILQQNGYQIVMPPANTRGYDIEAIKGDQRIAVQVKCHKIPCNVSLIEKFLAFQETPAAERFTYGWFVSASGFSKPAMTHVASEKPSRLSLWSIDDNRMVRRFPTQELPPPPTRQLNYFGVFTCKGGVGKTTIAAHLAGAFALMGHDVILLDLDPEKNLRKLFTQGEDGDASLYVPSPNKGEVGAAITVLNHDEWDEKAYPDVKVVICDCSPVLSENPRELVKKFDYCLIPTTLTPLGIAKNADVIVRTFRHIRELNSRTEMFALINAYDNAQQVAKRCEKLLAHLERHLAVYTKTDPKCRFIHPDAAAIRYSSTLQYWGYHIIEGTKPQLAFSEVGGRCFPRADFLRLAEYLEDHTAIDELRKHQQR